MASLSFFTQIRIILFVIPQEIYKMAKSNKKSQEINNTPFELQLYKKIARCQQSSDDNTETLPKQSITKHYINTTPTV
ncbi:unnamed protein product [marine sediment metagenome]|uniref:Uncharacterized protein n=1 Tax=marine sediment metagenome TaxID=412755 RepID=X1BBK1_9ZZZZ